MKKMNETESQPPYQLKKIQHDRRRIDGAGQATLSNLRGNFPTADSKIEIRGRRLNRDNVALLPLGQTASVTGFSNVVAFMERLVQANLPLLSPLNFEGFVSLPACSPPFTAHI